MHPWLLDEDPAQAAAWLCDAHVVHAPEEMAALLGTVWQWYVKHPPHTPHNWPADKPFLLPSLDLELPIVRWVMRNTSNFMWAATYANRACEEYHGRFGKRPLYAATCGVLNKAPYALSKGALQEFPYPVEVYRIMYATLPNIAWRYTDEPPWLSDYRR
jgi:hypothetical protein